MQQALEGIKNMPNAALLTVASLTISAWLFSQPEKDDSWLMKSFRSALRWGGLGVLGAWVYKNYGEQLLAAEKKKPADADKKAEKPTTSPFDAAPSAPTAPGAKTPDTAKETPGEYKLQTDTNGVYLWTDREHFYRIELYGSDGKPSGLVVGASPERNGMHTLTVRKEFDIPGGGKKTLDLTGAVSKDEIVRISDELRRGGGGRSISVEAMLDVNQLPSELIMVNNVPLMPISGKKQVNLREYAQGWLDTPIASKFVPGLRKLNETQYVLQQEVFFRAK